MADLSNINFSNLYCLFKGEPGTRKSTAALSFPKPQYWFSFDRKMDGLILPMRHWGVNPKDVTYDDYVDWNPALEKLKKLQVTCPYKTVVIDSVTSCADAINRQTLRLKSGTSKKDGEAAGKTIAGIPVNSIEDFNAEESALKELVAITKDIGSYHKVNIILIAHVIQKDVKNAAGQVTHVSRTIVTAGKGIAAKIPAYCSEVYHFNIKGGKLTGDGKYSLLTQHTGEDFARTSLDLDGEIVFDDKELYSEWILPAINKMTPKVEPQQPTTEQQNKWSK
jgi:hypothetical protein